ncbi:MAG: NHL repeat-containing protein [Nitrospinota bacterium]|nr:NHL repeat-containing protein [Nitrospinota bacterium]
MKEKMLTLLNSEEAKSYLEDTSDPKRITSFRAIADTIDGFSGLAHASLRKSGVLHDAEGLSPAGGIALADDGRIFISDEFNHRVCVYNADGKEHKAFGKKGAENGEFNYPRGLALDNSGNLYIADAWNHRIAVYSADLTFKTAFGELGAGIGELDEPVSLIVRGDRLYVLEKSNHRIQVFTLDGKPDGIIGGRGSVDEQNQFYMTNTVESLFPSPSFEYPSAITADRDGNIYVADTNNHRVIRISGATMRADTSFNLCGIKFPSGLVCDAEGNLHLTQFNMDFVSVFSPEGIHLYSYKPGMEVPVAIASRDNRLFVADGINSGVVFMEITPKHDRRISLEGRFNFHLKSALSLFANGKTGEAAKHLGMCASTQEKPQPEELGSLLPQGDYLFHTGNDALGADETKTAEPFAEMLAAYSSELLADAINTISEKTLDIDELSKVMLRLEIAFKTGRESNDDIMVEKYLVLKKIYAHTTSICKKFTSFKKIEELALRLAYIGIGKKYRLQTMSDNLDILLDLREKREGWYKTAEKEAPGLNFSSPPDHRQPFVYAFNKIEMLTWEFNLLSEFITEQNYELASLAGKINPSNLPILKDITIKSLDFIALFPETLESLLKLSRSLNVLLASIGQEKLKEALAPFDKEELWAPLSKEENIIPGRGSSYILLGALWTDGGFKGSPASVEGGWDKISSFYHGEFEKFEKEHTPLISETLRLAFQLPSSEKTDPKHAIEIRNKLALLGFHKYFQERYSCAMIKEYSVRYAMLMTSKPGITKEELKLPAQKIAGFLDGWASRQYKLSADFLTAFTNTQKENNLARKNDLRIESTRIVMESNFICCLGSFLLQTQRTISRVQTDNWIPSNRFKYFIGEMGSPETLFYPHTVTGKNGIFYIQSIENSRIHAFNGKGESLFSFGGYGTAEGLLKKPADMANTPSGGLAVIQEENSLISIFSLDGNYERRFSLQGVTKNVPMRMKIDSNWNIYVTYLDGVGISVFDSNGKWIREISRDSLGLPKSTSIFGFELTGERIITGGDGVLISSDLEGNVIKKLNSTGSDFKTFSHISASEEGNFLFTDYVRNRVLRVTGDFSKVEELTGIPSEGAVSSFQMDGKIAIADYLANRVVIFDPPKS